MQNSSPVVGAKLCLRYLVKAMWLEPGELPQSKIVHWEPRHFTQGQELSEKGLDTTPIPMERFQDTEKTKLINYECHYVEQGVWWGWYPNHL